MAMKVQIPFTYEDYKSLPESETKRYELLGGELVMVPAPLTYHQRVSRNLEDFLWDFVKDNELGEVYSAPIDVVLGRLGKEDVVQPDILFVAKDRLSIIAEEEIRGAPDLVVEIFRHRPLSVTARTRRGSMGATASKSSGSSTPTSKPSRSSSGRAEVFRAKLFMGAKISWSLLSYPGLLFLCVRCFKAKLCKF